MKNTTKIKPILGLGNIDVSLVDKKVQELLDAKQADKEFKDVGKRVSGSKKEKRAYKIVTFLDLAGLEDDPILAQQLVTKERVYPEVDVNAEREKGVSSGAAYLKVQFRKACSKQTQNNSKSRAGFVKFIEFFTKELDNCKTVSEILNVVVIINKWSVKDFMQNLYDPEGSINLTDEQIEKFKNKFYFSSSMTSKTIKLILGNNFNNLLFKKSDSAYEHWDFAKKYEPVSKERAEEYIKKRTEMIENQLIKSKQQSEEINKTPDKLLFGWAKTKFSIPSGFISKPELLRTQLVSMLERQQKDLQQSLNNPDPLLMEHGNIWDWFEVEKPTKERTVNTEPTINTGIPLDHIERKGGITIPSNFLSDARNKDESKNPLFSIYGFKSVQFGNALTDNRSREHMRHFLGAITDLGEILDIDIKQFNQLGSLSMAFASRGVGRYLAHYEGGLKIINLTNKRGDGSLAHEWGHYLDNVMTMLYDSSKIWYGFASHQENTVERTKGAIIGMADDLNVKQAMEDLMDSIYWKDDVTRKVRSNYYTSSSKMSSEYWTKPHELFARAWETYIFDKLDRAGRSNNYLTHDKYFRKITIKSGDKICLYPEGSERERLFERFDELIYQIKDSFNIGSFKPFSKIRKDEYEVFEEYNYEVLKFELLDLNLN